jgi:hypothetical protein
MTTRSDTGSTRRFVMGEPCLDLRRSSRTTDVLSHQRARAPIAADASLSIASSVQFDVSIRHWLRGELQGARRGTLDVLGRLGRSSRRGRVADGRRDG